jgi:hypothetical protein
MKSQNYELAALPEAASVTVLRLGTNLQVHKHFPTILTVAEVKRVATE